MLIKKMMFYVGLLVFVRNSCKHSDYGVRPLSKNSYINFFVKKICVYLNIQYHIQNLDLHTYRIHWILYKPVITKS